MLYRESCLINLPTHTRDFSHELVGSMLQYLAVNMRRRSHRLAKADTRPRFLPIVLQQISAGNSRVGHRGKSSLVSGRSTRTCICVIVFLRLSGVRFCVLRLDRMTDRQSGLLRQLEALDFSRVRLHKLRGLYNK